MAVIRRPKPTTPRPLAAPMPWPDLSAEIALGWEWCDHCEAYFLRCPKCGNNTCNGGRGDIGTVQPVPCDLCPAIYEIAALKLAAVKDAKEQEVDTAH